MKMNKTVLRSLAIIPGLIALLIVVPAMLWAADPSAPCDNGPKTEIFIQTGHAGSVNTVEWSPDGRFILSGSSDGGIKLWDAPSGRLIEHLWRAKTSATFNFCPAARPSFP